MLFGLDRIRVLLCECACVRACVVKTGKRSRTLDSGARRRKGVQLAVTPFVSERSRTHGEVVWRALKKKTQTHGHGNV